MLMGWAAVGSYVIPPKTFIEMYANIAVTLDDGTALNVDVHNYKCSNPAYGGTVEEEKYKDKVLNASKHKILQEMTASEFVGVFTGKGTIDNIAKVLSLCVRYGMVKADQDIPPQLQSICDKYIGLDCNGFVGNWANANNVTKFDCQTRPSDIAALYRDKRKSLDEIDTFDVLGFPDHIAVVQEVGNAVGPDRINVTVAEAFGRIMCQTRSLSVTKGVKGFLLTGHGSRCTAFDIGVG